jgi:hypothetical protein
VKWGGIFLFCFPPPEKQNNHTCRTLFPQGKTMSNESDSTANNRNAKKAELIERFWDRYIALVHSCGIKTANRVRLDKQLTPMRSD